MSGQPISRRRFLGVSAATLGVVVNATGASAVTPSQALGPFYPDQLPIDRDTNLARLAGHDQMATGQVIHIRGRVLDDHHNPVPDALVEIWQANAFGRYHHERDNRNAPLDAHFQGWGQMLTGTDGSYAFTTIKPGAYPAGGDWIRPPHIHFKVARRGHRELITQLYFAGEPLNATDRLLAQVAPEERPRLITELRSNQDRTTGDFDIVLTRAT